MWNKLKRIRTLWKLANKDPKYLKALEGLSSEDIKSIPNVGDGKAEFIPLMSEFERDEYIKNRDTFWGKFNEKLKELIK